MLGCISELIYELDELGFEFTKSSRIGSIPFVEYFKHKEHPSFSMELHYTSDNVARPEIHICSYNNYYKLHTGPVLEEAIKDVLENYLKDRGLIS